jgi:hypothetical protein
MSDADIRWMQRLQNYQRALTRLSEAVALSRQRPLSELEQQGLIQAFQFTHELAWKCPQRLFGGAGICGAIRVLREIRQDLYAKHPRSERLASWEAIQALKAELATAKVELSRFKCPFCGAPVAKRGTMLGDGGSAKLLNAATRRLTVSIQPLPIRS